MLIHVDGMDTAYSQLKLYCHQSNIAVLILVSLDVDSICACRILLSLLQSDNIQYQMQPVSGYSDITTAIENHRKQSQNNNNNDSADSSNNSNTVPIVSILINCGACADLNDLLDIESNPSLYIYCIDSHRPIHLDNIKSSQSNIIILSELDPSSFKQYYLDEMSDEESSDSDDDDNESLNNSEDENERQVRLLRKRQLKSNNLDRLKRRKHIWRERLISYYNGSSYGMNASTVLYILSTSMNKDSNDLLWFAIIGLTDQFINERIEMNNYNSNIQFLQEKVIEKNNILTAAAAASALNNDDNSENNSLIINHSDPRSVDSTINNSNLSRKYIKPGTIQFEDKEFRFLLLRHWTLYDSMQHSSYLASRIAIWTDRGQDQLKTMIANVGIPLSSARNLYQFMGSELKETLKIEFEDMAIQYKLTEATFGSFSKVSLLLTIDYIILTIDSLFNLRL